MVVVDEVQSMSPTPQPQATQPPQLSCASAPISPSQSPSQLPGRQAAGTHLNDRPLARYLPSAFIWSRGKGGKRRVRAESTKKGDQRDGGPGMKMEWGRQGK